jgi:predicted metal-dependent peptidase
MPRKKSTQSANDIMTLHDTSGSEIHNVPAQIGTVFSFYNMIQTEGGTPEMEAVYWDTCVRGHEKLKSTTKPNVAGGGGTYLPPVWEWIIKENKKPKGFIIFTDGYIGYDGSSIVGEYGRAVQRIAPMLWILSCKNVSFERAINDLKFGEVIHMDISANQRYKLR